MRYTEEMIPIGPTNHTHGVLNGRWSPGSRTRSTITPAATIANASSVPIDTSDAASRTVRNAAGIATPIPTMIWVIQGVRNFGWILFTTGGRSPSFDIE